MDPTSYSAIEPLISDLKVQGRTINIMFQCPLSQETVSARQHVNKSRTMGSQVKQSAQRSAMYAAQNMLSQVIREVFGYNLFGRVASDVTRKTVHSANSALSNSLSKAEKEQAIVDAFQSVSRKFTWDKANNRWISAKVVQEALSPFEAQQQQFPISHPYDLQILSRMLVEAANADGRISSEEQEWLINILDPNHGSIESILERPKLTKAELQQLSKGGVRETILMLVWTLTLCDEDFAHKEKALLKDFSSHLGLTSTQINSVRKKAQNYILDNAMETMFGWGGHDRFSRQNLLELAQNIGLSQDEALEAEALFQRRNAR